MIYNFSEELKRNISMEHRHHEAVSHTGVSETLVEFERQYADINASLESLNRAETHVLSLESIIVSLEAIKESTRGEKAVALAMANISLEAVEHSFELPTRTVAVSLEDGEPEEQTTTMVNKIKGALSAIKDSAVQVIGQIGQNLQALLGSVVAGATKFKTKLATLKSQAGNARGGQTLNLGKTANALSINGGSVDGKSYIRDLAETMKIVGSGLSTFKDVDDLKAFVDAALSGSKNGGKIDVQTFAKKLNTVKTLKGKKVLNGGEFTLNEVDVAQIQEYLDYCLAKYEKAKKKAEEKEGTSEPSMESILAVSMEDGEASDAPAEKRAAWKRWAGLILFVNGLWMFLVPPFFSGYIDMVLGHRIATGKWAFGLGNMWRGVTGQFSEESYSVSLESYELKEINAIAALASTMYLSDSSDTEEVKDVTSLNEKEVVQVADMLSSFADSTIAYAKSRKDRKAVTNDLIKSFKEVQKLESKENGKEIAGYINKSVNSAITNMISFETSLNKYALNVLHAGVAYVEASVNTKAVETPVVEA